MSLKPIGDFFTAILNRFGVSYLFSQPAESVTFWFLLSALLLFIVYIIGYYIYLRIKAKSQKPYSSYSKTFFWPNLSLSVVGLLNLSARYESIDVISWRFWFFLILAIIVAFNGWFFMNRKEQLREELSKLADTERKGRWLKPSKKRKK